jgi:preprotein translocase subunit SecD
VEPLVASACGQCCAIATWVQELANARSHLDHDDVCVRQRRGVAFAEGDIVDARALPDLAGMPTIMITFSGPAAKRFGVLTARRKGKPLPIMLDGKILAQPIVSEAVLRGEAQISGRWPYEEAVRLAKQISGKDPLPDDLEP